MKAWETVCPQPKSLRKPREDALSPLLPLFWVHLGDSEHRAGLGNDKQPGPLTLLFPSPQQLLTARALEFFPVLLALLIEKYKESAY